MQNNEKKNKELDGIKTIEEKIDRKDLIYETFTFNVYYI